LGELQQNSLLIGTGNIFQQTRNFARENREPKLSPRGPNARNTPAERNRSCQLSSGSGGYWTSLHELVIFGGITNGLCPRPDQQHITVEHVEGRWQLVDVGAAKDALTHACSPDPRIAIPPHIDLIIFSSRFPRPKLEITHRSRRARSIFPHPMREQSNEFPDAIEPEV
jgi:hypothetical protein